MLRRLWWEIRCWLRGECPFSYQETTRRCTRCGELWERHLSVRRVFRQSSLDAATRQPFGLWRRA